MTTRRLFPLALLTLGLAITAQSARAQSFPIDMNAADAKPDASVKVPAYDVASIKPTKAGDGRMSVMNNASGFSCENLSLQSLLMNAYNLRPDQISGGPAWAESKGFDVNAKVAGEDVAALKALNGRQRGAMLQALLADRFHLKVHSETKILPVYDLVVAKGGPKLKELPAADFAENDKDPDHPKHQYMIQTGPGMLKGSAMTAKAIASQLSFDLEKSVTDKTGLTGRYDIDLKWTPADATPAADNGATDAGASIFTAVQEQLGLKLVSTKGPVETLVIDHAELPTEN